MLYHLAIAVLGIVAMFAVWTAAQALKRRSDPRFGRGDDVLAGCGGCAGESMCQAFEERRAACLQAQAPRKE